MDLNYAGFYFNFERTVQNKIGTFVSQHIFQDTKTTFRVQPQ